MVFWIAVSHPNKSKHLGVLIPSIFSNLFSSPLWSEILQLLCIFSVFVYILLAFLSEQWAVQGPIFLMRGLFLFGDLSWEPRRQGYGCPWLRCSNKSVYLPAYPTITRNKSMELTHTFILYLTVCSHFIAASTDIFVIVPWCSSTSSLPS